MVAPAATTAPDQRRRRSRCARARRRTPFPVASALALGMLLPLAAVSSSVKECSAQPEEEGAAGTSGARARHHRRFPDLYTYEIVAEYPHDPAAFTQGLEYGVLCDDESNGNFTIREWYEPDDAPPSTASPAPSLAPQQRGRCREVLWESTGLYGQSQVRVVDLLTGVPIATTSLGREWFGEGLARVGDELLQLTWQGPKGFRWGARPRLGGGGGGGGLAPGGSGARAGLRVPPIGTFETPLQDGWGAAVDRTDYSGKGDAGGGEGAREAAAIGGGGGAGARQRQLAAAQRAPLVVLSDGSDRLTWVHPNNLSAVRHVDVRASLPSGAGAKAPVPRLNELEVVDGRVWANVWMTDCVAVVDGRSGEVEAWVLLHGLRRSLEGRRDVEGTARMDVLNGIAWDQRRRRLFVTGKLWPRLFEVRVVPLSASQRAEAARYLLPTCFARA